MPARDYLLHREEGIDLGLSLAACARKCACRGMPPTPVSEANRFRCRVDLDENLVLTSVSVFWRKPRSGH
jgi:hypothetical protein